jgi:hypothetical protein
MSVYSPDRRGGTSGYAVCGCFDVDIVVASGQPGLVLCGKKSNRDDFIEERKTRAQKIKEIN